MRMKELYEFCVSLTKFEYCFVFQNLDKATNFNDH